MKPSPRVMLLSGAFALLAGSAVLSDEAGGTKWVSVPVVG